NPESSNEISGFNDNDIKMVQNNSKVVKAKIQSGYKGIISGPGKINGKNVMGIIYLTTKPNHEYLIAGRGISKNDLLNNNPVALISKSIAKKGYVSPKNAINAGIELNGVSYTIAGVIEDEAELKEYQNYDVVVPKKFYMNNGADIPHDSMKLTFVKGADVSKETRAIVQDLNKKGSQHGNGSYDFMDMGDILKGASDTIKAVTYFVVAIASISLFIAGIGVMNMMYISVSERTQEIGIRMAVGATQHQILWQFLIEAIILTLTGGMIGYLSGIGLAKIISSFLPFKAIVTFSTFLLAFGTSTIIGLIFGILPAKTASNKNLIEILR
ncbi:MAG: ABC transporter permease, partial [Lactobacillaceae bacterium]